VTTSSVSARLNATIPDCRNALTCTKQTNVLAVEWVVLAVVNIAWFCYRPAPPATATDPVFTAATLALGMQGAAVRGVTVGRGFPQLGVVLDRPRR
jgi:hypothetical protein